MPSSLTELFFKSLTAVEPGARVAAALPELALGQRITLLALGKSAVPMSMAARRILGERITCEVVVAPDLPEHSPASWIQGAHPVANAESERGGRALLEAAARAEDSILFLVSGGGSALAEVPADGLSLAESSALVQAVYDAGADINELNSVRKHLSAIKGGGLARVASAPICTLLISDVVGDDPSAIASGPSVPDPTRFSDALRVVRKTLGDEVQGRAFEFLRAGAAGAHPETLKAARAGDSWRILAKRSALEEAARAIAAQEGEGSDPLCSLDAAIEGLPAALLSAARHPGLWIGGGEPRVRIPAEVGVGGRAQHLALLLACSIRGQQNIEVLVAGSDGVDGNSAAAGALVDGTSYQRMRSAGQDPEEALRRFDSARALAAIDAQLTTGPTGVNHADLVLLRRTCDPQEAE